MPIRYLDDEPAAADFEAPEAPDLEQLPVVEPLPKKRRRVRYMDEQAEIAPAYPSEPMVPKPFVPEVEKPLGSIDPVYGQADEDEFLARYEPQEERDVKAIPTHKDVLGAAEVGIIKPKTALGLLEKHYNVKRPKELVDDDASVSKFLGDIRKQDDLETLRNAPPDPEKIRKAVKKLDEGVLDPVWWKELGQESLTAVKDFLKDPTERQAWYEQSAQSYGGSFASMASSVLAIPLQVLGLTAEGLGAAHGKKLEDYNVAEIGALRVKEAFNNVFQTIEENLIIGGRKPRAAIKKAAKDLGEALAGDDGKALQTAIDRLREAGRVLDDQHYSGTADRARFGSNWKTLKRQDDIHSMEHPDNEELLVRLRQGDEEALKQLIENVSTPNYQYRLRKEDERRGGEAGKLAAEVMREIGAPDIAVAAAKGAGAGFQGGLTDPAAILQLLASKALLGNVLKTAKLGKNATRGQKIAHLAMDTGSGLVREAAPQIVYDLGAEKFTRKQAVENAVHEMMAVGPATAASAVMMQKVPEVLTNFIEEYKDGRKQMTNHEKLAWKALQEGDWQGAYQVLDTQIKPWQKPAETVIAPTDVAPGAGALTTPEVDAGVPPVPVTVDEAGQLQEIPPSVQAPAAVEPQAGETSPELDPAMFDFPDQEQAPAAGQDDLAAAEETVARLSKPRFEPNLLNPNAPPVQMPLSTAEKEQLATAQKRIVQIGKEAEKTAEKERARIEKEGLEAQQAAAEKANQERLIQGAVNEDEEGEYRRALAAAGRNEKAWFGKGTPQWIKERARRQGDVAYSAGGSLIITRQGLEKLDPGTRATMLSETDRRAKLGAAVQNTAPVERRGLSDFIKSRGSIGVFDADGKLNSGISDILDRWGIDLAKIQGKAALEKELKRTGGVVTLTGRSPDQMAETLAEAGYLEGRDLDQMWEKLGAEVRGQEQYAISEQGETEGATFPRSQLGTVQTDPESGAPVEVVEAGDLEPGRQFLTGVGPDGRSGYFTVQDTPEGAKTVLLKDHPDARVKVDSMVGKEPKTEVETDPQPEDSTQVGIEPSVNAAAESRNVADSSHELTPAEFMATLEAGGVKVRTGRKTLEKFLSLLKKAMPEAFGALRVVVAGDAYYKQLARIYPSMKNVEGFAAILHRSGGVKTIYINPENLRSGGQLALQLFEEVGHFIEASLSDEAKAELDLAWNELTAEQRKEIRAGYEATWRESGFDVPTFSDKVIRSEWFAQQIVRLLRDGKPLDRVLSQKEKIVQAVKQFISKFQELFRVAKAEEDYLRQEGLLYGEIDVSPRIQQILQRVLRTDIGKPIVARRGEEMALATVGRGLTEGESRAILRDDESQKTSIPDSNQVRARAGSKGPRQIAQGTLEKEIDFRAISSEYNRLKLRFVSIAGDFDEANPTHVAAWSAFAQFTVRVALQNGIAIDVNADGVVLDTKEGEVEALLDAKVASQKDVPLTRFFYGGEAAVYFDDKGKRVVKSYAKSHLGAYGLTLGPVVDADGTAKLRIQNGTLQDLIQRFEWLEDIGDTVPVTVGGIDPDGKLLTSSPMMQEVDSAAEMQPWLTVHKAKRVGLSSEVGKQISVSREALNNQYLIQGKSGKTYLATDVRADNFLKDDAGRVLSSDFILRQLTAAEVKAIEEDGPTLAAPGKAIFFSKLQRTIEAKMPNMAPAAQVIAIVRNPQNGVKDEEVKWSGLEDWLKDKPKGVSKQELLEFLKSNEVKVEEVEKNQKYPDDTKFSQYQLPGGFNYRELLLTLPVKQGKSYSDFLAKGMSDREAQQASQAAFQQSFNTPHFEEDNILAHVRFNERTVDGKKVLFLEEVQSDWHQKGRKQGYSKPSQIARVNELRKIVNDLSLKAAKLRLSKDLRDPDIWREHNALQEKLLEYQGEIDTLKKEGGTTGIPDAPFKKTWHELAMKRMLRWAAEHGFDSLAWTTGEQQAQRYDLSKQISKVISHKLPDDGYHLEIIGKNGEKLTDRRYEKKVLPDVVGKELTEKILQKSEESERNEFTDLDLKVGGEGMKGFYDQILPAFLSKYGKKWGAKVGRINMKVLAETDIMSEEETFETDTVHSVEITPAMRESVMDEQSLFAPGKSLAEEFGYPEAPKTLADNDPLLQETVKKQGREKIRDGILYNILSKAVRVPDDKQPVIYFTAGGGGAGKSTVVNMLKEQGLILSKGVAEIDSDEIKKEIPEYDQIIARGDGRAAEIVHEESSLIAKTALGKALEKRTDIIYDGTLANYENSITLIDKAKAAGYRVEVIGVVVDVEIALRRAAARAKETNRYVPIRELLRAHKGFARNIEKYAARADSMWIFDNSVDGRESVRIARKNEKGFAILDQARYISVGKVANVNENATSKSELHQTPDGRRSEGISGIASNARPTGSDRRHQADEGQGTPGKTPDHGLLPEQRLSDDESLAAPGKENPAQLSLDALFAPTKVDPDSVPDRPLFTPSEEKDLAAKRKERQPLTFAPDELTLQQDDTRGSDRDREAGYPRGETGRDRRDRQVDPTTGGGVSPVDDARRVGDVATLGGERSGTRSVAAEKVVSPEEQKRRQRSNDTRLNVSQPVELTPRRRVDMNLAAMRIVAATRKSPGRTITEDERNTLRQYTGWGGLANEFLDPRKGQQTIDEVVSLIGEPGLSAARAGVANAHYTSYAVVKFAWDVVQKLGFKAGRVLEPAMGVGNFIGLMPKGMPAEVMGVELDPLTADISKLLYPDSQVIGGGFETIDGHNDYFDLAISNVPFGDFKPMLQMTDPYFKLKPLIHDYFILRMLDKVQPGGLVVAVTGKGTLDKLNPAIRKLLSEKADLVAAYRLPDTAFKDNADTQVTTDLLILRKKGGGAFAGATFEGLGKDAASGLRVNEYFVAHPENMFGKMAEGGMMNRSQGKLTGVAASELPAYFEKALAKLPKLPAVVRPFSAEQSTEGTATVAADPTLRAGELYIDDGKLFSVVAKGQAVAQVIPPAALEQVKSALGIKRVLNKLLRTQIESGTDTLLKGLQAELRARVDAHIKKYAKIVAISTETEGKIRTEPPLATRTLEQYMAEDPDYYKITGLVDHRGNLSDIFTARTIFSAGFEPKDPDSTAELGDVALYVRHQKGALDVAEIARIKKVSEAQVREGLLASGTAFADPADSKRLIHRIEYLAGDDVYTKLDEAEAAARKDPELYQRNADALRAIIPEKILLEKITINTRQRYFNVDLFAKFLNSKLQGNFTAKGFLTGRVEIRGNGRLDAELGINDASYPEAFQAYANNEKVRVRGEDSESLSDTQRQALAARKEALRKFEAKTSSDFTKWLRENETLDLGDGETIRAHIERTYNQTFNRSVQAEFDGSTLKFIGMAGEMGGKPMMIHKHNLDFAARMLFEGRGGNAHVVGAGKTFAGVLSAKAWKQAGLAQKPLFIVPKKVLAKWAREYAQLFPGDTIMVIDEFDKANRERLMGRIAVSKPDAIFMTHDQFKMIPNNPEVEKRLMEEEMQVLRDQLMEIQDDKNASKRTIRSIENSIEKLETKLHDLGQFGKTNRINFTELGIDALIVDEAHNFKNLPVQTKLQASGVPSGASQRSFDLYMKTRQVLEGNQNRGVLLLTATPISNTLAEVYNMLRFISPESWTGRGIRNFDQWVAQFGEIVTKPQILTDGTFGVRSSLSSFRNLGELQDIFNQYWDIKSAEELKLKRPTPNRMTHVVEPSAEQQSFFQSIIKRAEAIKNRKVEPSEDNMLNLSTDGRKAALDMRLIHPAMTDHAGSKLNFVADEIWRRYQAGAKDPEKKSSGQLVFFDMYSLSALEEMATAEEAQAKGEPEEEEIAPDAPRTPSREKKPRKKGEFNLHDDLVRKLVERGIPAKEIAILNGVTNNSAEKKDNVSILYNEGHYRVVIGTTAAMGEGMNLQKITTAIHHVDVPMKPSHMEQRDGRGLRQGNIHPVIDLVRYTTRGSFDQSLYQMLARKADFIEKFSGGKDIGQNVDDATDSTALDYETVMGATSADPRVREYFVGKLKLTEAEVAVRGAQEELRGAKAAAARYEREAAYAAKNIAATEKAIAERNERFGKLLGKDFDPQKLPEKLPLELSVSGQSYTDEKEIHQRLGTYMQSGAAGLIVATESFPAGGFTLNGIRYESREPDQATQHAFDISPQAKLVMTAGNHMQTKPDTSPAGYVMGRLRYDLRTLDAVLTRTQGESKVAKDGQQAAERRAEAAKGATGGAIQTWQELSQQVKSLGQEIGMVPKEAKVAEGEKSAEPTEGAREETEPPAGPDESTLAAPGRSRLEIREDIADTKPSEDDSSLLHGGQVIWLRSEAKKLGFDNLAELVKGNSAKLKDLARQWREEHPFPSDDSSLAAPGKGDNSLVFKKWFGESKVVDDRGKPLVVYHGGSGGPTDFAGGSSRGVGLAYFSDDVKVASKYAIGGGIDPKLSVEDYLETLSEHREKGKLLNRRPAITPVFLKIINPVTERTSVRDLFSDSRGKATRIMGDGSTDLMAEMEDFQRFEDREMNDDEFWELIERHTSDGFAQEDTDSMPRGMRSLASLVAMHRDEFKEFDGLIYEDQEAGGTTYVVFQPEQVKSAIGNRGTFDPSNPDILAAPGKGEEGKEEMSRWTELSDAQARQAANEANRRAFQEIVKKEERDGGFSPSLERFQELQGLERYNFLRETLGDKFRTADSFREDPYERLNPASVAAGSEVANESKLAGDFVGQQLMSEKPIENPWKRLAKGGRLVYRSTTDTLRHAGGRLAILADKIDLYFDKMADLIGRRSKPFGDILRGLSRAEKKVAATEFEAYMRQKESTEKDDTQAIGELDATYNKMSPGAKKLVDEVRKLFEFTGRVNKQLNVHVIDKDAPGGWRPIGDFGADYWPRILKREYREVLQEPNSNPKLYAQLETELMQQTGIKDPERLKQFILKNMSVETQNSFMANLEMARKGKLPTSFYEHRFEKVIPYFIASWSKRIAQINAFGQSVKKDKDAFDTLLDELIGKDTRGYLLDVRDTIYERRRRSGAHALMTWLRVYTTASKLGNLWTSIRNTSTIAMNTIPEFGFRAAIPELVKLQEYAKQIRTAEELGILRADLLAGMAETEDFTELQQQVAATSLKWGGFTLVENITRGTAAAISLSWARHGLALVEKKPDSRAAIIFTGRLNRYGISLEALQKEGLAGEEARKLMRAAVANTQFTYDMRQVPLWSENPTAKFLFQFMKFGVQMARRVIQDVGKPAFFGYLPNGSLATWAERGNATRDMRPLLLWMAMAVGTGEGLYWLREWLFGKKRTDATIEEIMNTAKENQMRAGALIFQRIWHDMIYAGGFGIIGDYASNMEDLAFRVRARSPIDPPGLGPFKNIWENLVMRGLQQKGLGWADVMNAAKNELPAINYTDALLKKHGLRVAVAIGKDWKGARLQEAKTDMRDVRLLGYRYVTEMEIERPATGGVFTRNPNSPVYDKLQDALLIGDVEEATRITDQFITDVGDTKKALRMLKSSVRNRQPVKVGGMAKEELQEDFEDWVKRRAPSFLPKLQELDQRYHDTAKEAGVW